MRVIATQLLGVFERESFVCRAGSPGRASHLLVLVLGSLDIHIPR